MRSPLIAFSLLAAVSPTIVAAAPQSPTFNGEAFTKPKNTDVKLPQRFAVPRSAPAGLGLVSDATSHHLPSAMDASRFNTNSPGSGDVLSMLQQSSSAPGTSAPAGGLQDDAATSGRSTRSGVVPEAVPSRQPKMPAVITAPNREPATARQGGQQGVGNGAGNGAAKGGSSGSSSSDTSSGSADTSSGNAAGDTGNTVGDLVGP